MRSLFQISAALLLAVFGLVSTGRAGSATSVNGLFYTGVNNSGGLLAGGAQDSHWSVVYANAPGTDSTYEGAAYVVSGAYLDAGWVDNTANAQWITAPGARTSATGGSGTANNGGTFLPGNGTSGSNAATYVYRLAFTIGGTGGNGSNVTNNVSISLTIAADDRYEIYVNPTMSGGEIAGSNTAAATRNSSWNNTSAEYLQNYNGGGHSDNANFVIGTNYIYIVVDNTNSITGSSGNNDLNPSGLLVYQVGSAVLIDGKPVPEVGAILPVIGALGLFALRRFRARAA
jgi:hypothetical protein